MRGIRSFWLQLLFTLCENFVMDEPIEIFIIKQLTMILSKGRGEVKPLYFQVNMKYDKMHNLVSYPEIFLQFLPHY